MALALHVLLRVVGKANGNTNCDDNMMMGVVILLNVILFGTCFSV